MTAAARRPDSRAVEWARELIAEADRGDTDRGPAEQAQWIGRATATLQELIRGA